MSDTLRKSPAPAWGSVADVKTLEANPVLAATTLSRIFGSSATSVAAWCALYAHHDGQEGRYQIWLAAFKRLQAPKIDQCT